MTTLADTPAPWRRRSARGRDWQLLALLLCLPTCVPLLAAALAWTHEDAATTSHLLEHVLPLASANTLWLVLGVVLGSTLIGTTLAALVALTEFPGRQFFSWALLLPLALPGYVMAVALIGLFDYAGTIPSMLRAIGFEAYWEFRSLGGLTLTMVLALYPYVYLVARQAFASQGLRAIEAARALGMTSSMAFFRASLPLARPAIAAGALLVAMETVADFGTVSAFNVDTLTSAIYKAWFSLFSIDAALRIAGVLLLLVLALLVIEARGRSQQGFTSVGANPVKALPLARRGLWASAFCGVIFAVAFLLPLTRLIWLAAPHYLQIDHRWLGFAANSLLLGLSAAAICVLVALLLALAVRERQGIATRSAHRLATLGYGLPGALLAVGLYLPFARASSWLADQFQWDIALHGSLGLLLLAYMVRFTAVAQAAVDSALARVRPSLVEAARTLGVRGWRLGARVHAPLMSGGLITGAVLVFVDTMKEMPITLMMRPFGWDTLATRVFELTNEGLWAQAALPALAIVLVGLLPVWWLQKRTAA